MSVQRSPVSGLGEARDSGWESGEESMESRLGFGFGFELGIAHLEEKKNEIVDELGLHPSSI